MRERVGELVGGVGAGDVGDDLPLRLRADPARRRRAARLHARLHDLRRGRLAADAEALHGRARARPEALPAAGDPVARSRGAKNQLDRRRGLPRGARAASSRRPSPTSTRSTRSGCSRPTRWTSTTCWSARSTLLELFEDVRERWRSAFRYVLVDEYQDTNHAQYRLLQLLVRRARQPDGRRRRRPVDLRLPRAPTSATSSTSSATSPSAEVVKLEQNYRSTQTILSAANAVVARQPRAARASALDRDRGRRAGAARRARRRARGGALRRRRDRAPRDEEDVRRERRRGLLPDQRAEPGARGHAGPLRGPLPGDRRHQVLRAGRDQGRARLPQPARQPRRPVSLLARIVNSPRRGIGDTHAGRGSLSHANTIGAADLGGRRPGRGGAGARRRGASRRSRASLETMDGLRERAEPTAPSPSCSRRCCARAATSRRSRPSARSRPRGGSRTSRSWSASRGEFDANREVEGDVRDRRRWRSSCSRSRSTPTRTRCARPRALVTLMTLHNAKGLEYDAVFIIGCEEGVFPHIALARRGRRGGGAAPLLRRHHPRPAAPLHDLGARAAPVRRRAATTCPRASSTSCPPSWPSATATAPRAGGLGASTAGRGPRRRRRRAARPGARARHRRRRRPRQLRRGRRDRGRAGRGGRRALRRRRLRAQADGRLRAASQGEV